MIQLLTTFLVSMVPVIELRGAIPIGVAAGVDLPVAILVSIIGNIIPIPFILFFIKKIFAWMSQHSEWMKRFVDKMEARAAAKSDAVKKGEFIGLFLFVAIPLPGTGAWTGSLIAAMLDIEPKRAFVPLALGVLGAAVIISFVTYGAWSLITG